jgi:hypothetical protein
MISLIVGLILLAMQIISFAVFDTTAFTWIWIGLVILILIQGLFRYTKPYLIIENGLLTRNTIPIKRLWIKEITEINRVSRGIYVLTTPSQKVKIYGDLCAGLSHQELEELLLKILDENGKGKP